MKVSKDSQRKRKSSQPRGSSFINSCETNNEKKIDIFEKFDSINIIENKYPINEQDSPSCSNYPAIKNIKLELLPETNYFENDNFINKQNVSQLDNLSKNIKHENLHETNIIDNKQTFIEQNITNPLKMSILTNKIDNLNLSSDLNNIKNKQKFDEKSFFNCSKKIREIEEEDSLSELSDFELKEPINNQNFLSFFQLKSLIRKILEDENKKNSLKKNQSNNEQKLNVSEIENLIRHIITIMLSEGVQLNIKKDSLINSKIQNKTEIINNYEKKQKLSKCNSTTNLKTIKPTRKIPISNKNINENQQDFLSYSKKLNTSTDIKSPYSIIGIIINDNQELRFVAIENDSKIRKDFSLEEALKIGGSEFFRFIETNLQHLWSSLNT